MGVYIKGMEMPDSCRECRFWDISIYWKTELGYCRAAQKHHSGSIEEQRRICPLVEIPQSHGMLIDKDAYSKELFRMRVETSKLFLETLNDEINSERASSALATLVECSIILDKMPTIIEAEE